MDSIFGNFWQFLAFLTLPHTAYRILWLLRGGCLKEPPRDIKEGVTLDPILFKVILKPIQILITCKNFDQNIKNLARFQDLNRDFTTP